MSNDIRKIGNAVQLPYDVVPTVSTGSDWSAKDSVSIDEHPYRTAFFNGVAEGFKLPFAALFGVFGLVGCDSGNRLAHYPNEDASSTDGGKKNDGSADVSTSEVADVYYYDVGIDTSDAGPIQTDAELDVGPDATPDAAEDMAQDATATQDAADIAQDATMTDAELDAGTDAEADAAVDTAADASGTQDVAEDISVTPDVAEDAIGDAAVDGVILPEDASSDVGTEDAQDAAIQDAAVDVMDDVAAPFCQYFCDAGISADLPADVSAADDANVVPTTVYSNICALPTGPLTLSAPINSVAVACTNDTINSLILGAKGCVAECGFYDNNVIISTNPNMPVAFATYLFAPPVNPNKPYTITLTMQAPTLSNGSTPALPGFMGSSLVFAFNQSLYNMVGDIQWETQDKKIQIKYQPQDYWLGFPETLDITSIELAGNKVSYRYPCDTLVDENGISNPVVKCTEVK